MRAEGSIRIVDGPHPGPSCTYEYTEDGRLLVAHRDGRDDGDTLYIHTDTWTIPAGAPIDADARERIWCGFAAGGGKVFDRSALTSGLGVAVSLPPGRSFIVDVHDGGALDYHELRRTLRLAYRETSGAASRVVAVDLPREPRWSFPASELITSQDLARVAERLASASAEDMHVPRALRITLVNPA